MHPFFDSLPAKERELLEKLVDRFLAENAVINLSALRTKDACFIGNVLDSLAFRLFVEKEKIKGGKLIDIGTGGGFPLLPIAIAFPELKCTGFDAVKKKVAAVERIAKDLGLPNVSMFAERTEIAGRLKAHREHYNIVTARAVAPLAILLEYVSPFVAVGGYLVLWKSLHIADELEKARAAAKILGMKLEDQLTYELPADFGTRQLLIYKKISATPVLYPRKIGEAKHHPITD